MTDTTAAPFDLAPCIAAGQHLDSFAHDLDHGLNYCRADLAAATMEANPPTYRHGLPVPHIYAAGDRVRAIRTNGAVTRGEEYVVAGGGSYVITLEGSPAWQYAATFEPVAR